MRTIFFLLAAGTLLAQQQPPPLRIPNGSLAAQVAGRIGFYTDGTLDGYGYFSYIEGFDLPLFSSQPSERTAHFTFRSDKTFADVVSNDRMYHLIYRPVTGQWVRVHIYYNPVPSGDFAKPGSFEAGQRIATFRKTGLRINLNPPKFFQFTSGLVLESSADFTIGDRKFNIKDFLNAGSAAFTGPIFPSFAAYLEQLAIGDFGLPFGGTLTAANAGNEN